MAIPSGSGTEVLKRASINNMTNSWTPVITGVANHIYTVISVIFCEQGNATESPSMRVDVSAAGSNQIQILEATPITPYSTFVFSDRIVLTGTDKLEVKNEGSTSSIDVWVSYIDQDWS
jgi:hypothetical protein